MKRDEMSEFTDDDLDRIVRDALKTSAEPQRVRHLEDYWRSLSRKHVWRQRLWRLMPAAAAAVLAFVALAILRGRDDADPQHDHAMHARASRQPKNAQVAPVDADSAEVSPLSDATKSIGRPPTDYERFMYMARAGARSPSGSATSSKNASQKIDEIVAQLAAATDADAQAVLAGAEVDSRVAERLLLRRLARSRGAEQTATLRALAACGTPRSIPAILRSAQRGASLEQVLQTVEAISGIAGVSHVAENTSDVPLRIAAIERLLKFDSDAAQLAFLKLVRNESTRTVSLTTVDRDDHPPVDALLKLLDHEEKWIRQSSAMVLGHVNGPDITRALIARVTERPSESAEAWGALMECRGAMAAEFLDYASRRPQLLGHLNSARLQWIQSIQ